MFKHSWLSWLVLVACLGAPSRASSQAIESVGARALGMGGAFVAVANDSTASWWNPGGQATGPFLDVSLGLARTQAADSLPSARTRPIWATVAIPPLGASYYRFRITTASASSTTGQDGRNRQAEGAGVPYRSLSASQLGVTVGQSLWSGAHVGATVKYVRGTLRTGVAEPNASLSTALDRADALEGGDTEGHLDVDVGVIALTGPIRIGAVLRNLAQPEFSDAAGSTMQLPRQVRVGAAFDGEARGSLPLVVAVDADLRSYAAGTGDRRVVAVGAERWFAAKRLGVRGGGRFNTVGREERAFTGGVSVAARAGLWLDAHVVGGGSRDERGWGAAARVSF